MTPRERILAVLAGQQTDVVPYQEIFFGHLGVAEHFGGPQGSTDSQARYVAHSGMCSLLVGGFWWCPGNHYHETSEGVSRYEASHKPWTMDDVEQMQEPDIDEKLQHIQEMIVSARKHQLATHVFIMNCFHSASTSMGLENLCMTMYDDPEVLSAYLDRIELFNQKVLTRLWDYDIDFVFVDGDCAYKSGLMVRPELFRQLWYDRTDKTMDICRQRGWPYCFHTDGKIDQIYPMLIEMGFSAHHGVEKAANDLADIKKRFGTQITLIGNFDIVDLANQSPETITTLTREMLAVGSPGGRYVAACNTLPGNNIPLENYLAFRNAIVTYSTGE